MDRSEVEALLRDVAAGSVAVEAARRDAGRRADERLGRPRLRPGGHAPRAAHRRPRGRLRGRQVAPTRRSRSCAELARQDGGRPALATRLPGRRPRGGAARRSRTRWSTRWPAPSRSARCRRAAARCASWRPAPRTRRSRPRLRSWPGPSAPTVDRVDDVGVAGHPPADGGARPAGRGRLPRRRGRHGRCAAERGRRADRRTAGRRPDLGRLRHLVRRSGRPAGDAQLVRARRRRCATSTTASGPGCSRPGWPGGRPCGPRVTVAWVDASAGASGDMLLGALVGAGADLAVLQAAVDALGTEPVRLTARPVTRAGLAATQVEVAAPASDVRRTWPDVRALLEGADLADPVRDLALDVFARLARAEAAAHGIARRRGALPRGRCARLAGRRGRRLRGAARPGGQRGALHRRWPSGRAACGPSTGCCRCRGRRSSRCSPRSGHRSGPATSTARRARRPARRCWRRR